MNFSSQIKNHLKVIFDRDDLFYWDQKYEDLYTHDLELACEILDNIGFEYAYHDDFHLVVISKPMIDALNLIQGDLVPENMAEFLKNLYERFTMQKIYTSNEYNDLYAQKNQLEKTMNDIKGLL